MRKWTQTEIDYVIKHYPYERAEDVGKVIDRSAGAVMHMAHDLNVYKDEDALRKIKSISNSGVNSGNFKGYRQRTKDGYIWCRAENHPFANSKGYVKEHRLIAEKHLGFILPKEFVVHHINGVKDDNRIENLAVMTIGAHSALHGRKGRDIPKGEKNPKYKAVDFTVVKEMQENGFTVNQICEHFNITKTTFYRKIRRERL